MTLTHLIERCESGAGPDQLLNVQIENALGIAKFRQAHWGVAFDQLRVDVLPLTSSLDAVISLIEQKLPGTGVDCHIVPGNEPPCDAYAWPAECSDSFRGEGTSLVRALLAAFLKAYANKEGGHDL